MGKEDKQHKTLLSVEYLDDEILLSAGEAWTYMKIPLTSYEFITTRDRENLAHQMNLALTNLATSSTETVDVHLRIVNQPFDSVTWAVKLDERAQKSDPTSGWNNYLLNMEDRVASLGFKEKEVFLGVKLGLRARGGKAGEGGSKDIMGELLAPLKKITSLVEKTAGMEDYEVSVKELAYWHKKARDIRRALSQSYLHATGATAKDMARVIARPFWPLMPQPEPTFSDSTVWGKGDLIQLASGSLTHRRKDLEIVQTVLDPGTGTPVDIVGYSATLAVSRFPDILYFPEQEPWIHFIAALSFSVDFSSRFSIVPPIQVKKDVSKKLADARDQAQHIAETGSGIPLHIREQVETAATLEYQIDKQRMPWAYARHRLIITGETEDDLADKCRKVIEDYRELGIDIVWPTGDQLNLFLEASPGDKVRLNSYYQRQDLAVISGGMPTAAGACGDLVRDGKGWRGPYIGYTLLGVASPVTFAANASIAQNHPPGVAITGAPGGGKALAVNTPILTPKGWMTMGELRPGDQVYGIDGNPCNVVDATDTMFNRPCYTVEFRSGETITADADHEWFAQEKHLPAEARGGEWARCSRYTTEELFRRQVFHGDNSEPSWLGRGEKSASHHTTVYSIPHSQPLSASNEPNLYENTDFYTAGFAYFLNDYLSDENRESDWEENTPVGDLIYEFGTNCADTSPQTTADIPQNLIDEKFRKCTENFYPRARNSPYGASAACEQDLAAFPYKEQVNEKYLTGGEGTRLTHSRFLEKHFPKTVTADDTCEKEAALVYVRENLIEIFRQEALLDEEADYHTAAFRLFLNATTIQKQQFIQGVIDAYFRYTEKTNIKHGTEAGVITVKTEEAAENLAVLFSMVGYGTQYGKNETTLLPPDSNISAPTEKNMNSKHRSFVAHVKVSQQGPLDAIKLHLEDEEKISPTAPETWFLAYTENIPHEIVSITPTRSAPVRCIQVDGPYSLYLAGRNLIPTHNSFLAFTIAYQMALQGIWTIYIDPKADAKPMGELKGLGTPRVFDLRHGNDGMLDPFSLGKNPSESRLLALETIRLLLGGSVSEEREEALLNAIEKVGTQPDPSLTKVVDYLLANANSAGSRNLGAVLRTLRDLPFARLCFSATTGQPLRPEDGLTIVTLLGLDLPTANTKPEDYSYENRLAVAVMYLLTRYSRKLMLSLDKSHPKAICIDEAWAVASTPQGAKLIPEVARMGRSHNTALVLVSQNAGDLMDEKITNNLSTKFAFRSSNPQEIRDILALLGIAENEGYEQSIQNLRNGQCVMQDASGRTNVVQVDAWNKELFDTFNTNPETRGK